MRSDNRPRRRLTRLRVARQRQRPSQAERDPGRGSDDSHGCARQLLPQGARAAPRARRQLPQDRGGPHEGRHHLDRYPYSRTSFTDLWDDLRTVTNEIRPDWDLSKPALHQAWDPGDYSPSHEMVPTSYDSYDRGCPESRPRVGHSLPFICVGRPGRLPGPPRARRAAPSATMPPKPILRRLR
jgi:hypothetical protein